MTDSPKIILRDRIAARIHASDCGCPDFRSDGSDADDVYYRRLADAVMELFPEVEAEHEYRRDGWVFRYVLRTAPEPIERPS
jgi:hypothetical protein